MGDGEKASLRLQFNPKVRLAFHGATITTDAGLLAFREFDDALGLTEIAEDYLQESRTVRWYPKTRQVAKRESSS